MDQIYTDTSTAKQPYSALTIGETYGIVVDDHLDSALIKVGLKALENRNVDMVVFLCLAPHKIRQRADWPDIKAHLRFAEGEGKCDVMRICTPEELLKASLDMKIIQLPTGGGYSIW